MILNKTKIEGLYVIDPELRVDMRGYFAEVLNQKEFVQNGLVFEIAQINQSLSKKKGTIRGMHFQNEPKSEIKIVQCLSGAIYDVAIDLRENSPTYGQFFGLELSEKNKKILFVPKGFAHGFQTLTDNCLVQYFMSEFYSPEHKGGVRFDDPFFNIKWPIKKSIVLQKDKDWPLIDESKKNTVNR